MEVYGLTGGIGSGKSTVAALLEEYGVPVVSADELSRMVVAPGSRGLADVVEAFGSEVLDERGELDRKKMGRIVFTTPERRRQLEAILHPRIRERYEQVLDALEKAGHPVMIYEVPLLFEKKLEQQDEMTAVILVTATAETRIARVKARDDLTTDEVLARMRTQMPEHEKRERANYVIHNDGDLDDLRREVEYLISRFLRLAPRGEPSATDEFIEELDAELELEESEVDTLAPEQTPDVPAPSHESATVPNVAPVPYPPPSHAAGLEVELQPIASSSSIPGVVIPPVAAAPAPVVAAPTPASAPHPVATSRPVATSHPVAASHPAAAPPPAAAAAPPPAAAAAPPPPAAAAPPPPAAAAPPPPAVAAPVAAPPPPAVAAPPPPATGPAVDPPAARSSASWIPAGSKAAPAPSRNRPITAPQLTVPAEALQEPGSQTEESGK